MSIRDTLHKHPTAVITTAVVMILAALAVIVWQSGGAGPGGTGEGFGGPMKAFFSVDDGRTFFADDGRKLPPFTTADGKLAVRAQVVRCGNGEPYVAYLERFSDADKKRLEAQMSKPGGSADAMLFIGASSNVMVKRPGVDPDHGWIRLTQQTVQQYKAVVEVKCADGSTPTRFAPE